MPQSKPLHKTVPGGFSRPSAYVGLCNQQVEEQIRTFSNIFLNSRDRLSNSVIILRVSSIIQNLSFTRYVFLTVLFLHIFTSHFFSEVA